MTFHSEKQKIVYKFIEAFIKENEYSPRLKDIAENTGVTVKAIHEHVKRLEERGLLKRNKGRQGIELTSTSHT